MTFYHSYIYSQVRQRWVQMLLILTTRPFRRLHGVGLVYTSFDTWNLPCQIVLLICPASSSRAAVGSLTTEGGISES